MKSAGMLLATASAIPSPEPGDAPLPHTPDATVGMNATPGASIPARFIRTSSPSVLPFRASREAPIVTRTPMNTAFTGVK